MKSRSIGTMLAAMLIAISMTLPAFAQPGPGPGGQQGQGGFGQGQGGFQGRGNFDPAQIRQTLNDRYKDALGASDDEWAVISPKLEKIQELQADAGGGIAGSIGVLMRSFGRMGGGRGGPGGGMGGGRGFTNPFGGSDSVMQRKMLALQEALDKQDMPAAEIKSRLEAVRAERDRVRVELDKARKELIDLLTPRQEAVLFQMGILE